jgi:predicted DNA-binding ribbon-helix-helix protein
MWHCSLVAQRDPCGLLVVFQAARGAARSSAAKQLKNLVISYHRSGDMNGAAPRKHSVRIAGHATSVCVEAAFWEGLCAIAAHRRISVSALLARIDAGRSGSLASAIRLFVLESCRRGELADRPPPAKPP